MATLTLWNDAVSFFAQKAELTPEEVSAQFQTLVGPPADNKIHALADSEVMSKGDFREIFPNVPPILLRATVKAFVSFVREYDYGGAKVLNTPVMGVPQEDMPSYPVFKELCVDRQFENGRLFTNEAGKVVFSTPYLFSDVTPSSDGLEKLSVLAIAPRKLTIEACLPYVEGPYLLKAATEARSNYGLLDAFKWFPRGKQVPRQFRADLEGTCIFFAGTVIGYRELPGKFDIAMVEIDSGGFPQLRLIYTNLHGYPNHYVLVKSSQVQRF